MPWRIPSCTVAALLALATAASVRAGSAETLAQAEQIRADVERGRPSLAVTEASSTEVVHSLTLLSSTTARLVPTAGGVYYAICPTRALCPYPGHRGRRPRDLRARRMGLELAMQTFRRTVAGLVVVSLPTRQPLLLVLERGDVPEHGSRAVLDRLTLAHLYSLRALVPLSDTAETLVLARI